MCTCAHSAQSLTSRNALYHSSTGRHWRLDRDGPEREAATSAIAPVSEGNWTETDEHHTTPRAAHEDRAHSRGLRARSPRLAAMAWRSARADDGRAARGPPLADPPCTPPVRPRGGLAVRESLAVQRARRPRALPPRRGTRRPAGAGAGADILFAPPVEEVYPQGFATTVEVLGVTERLEGVSRGSEHFRGVTTVVTKLLCMTLPDVAYFGQKDAQQVVVIRRLVTDLNLPVRFEALPTVRELDGLAMSSRNALLTAVERERALALPAALPPAASSAAAAGERSAAALIEPLRASSCVPVRSGATTSPWSTRSARSRWASWIAALLALAARVGADAPDRQHDPAAGGRRGHGPTPRERCSPDAACDAEVEDPPGDSHRLRPALRRLDHDRPAICWRRRTTSSTSRCTLSTWTTAPALRPTRSPASAARARCRSTARRRGSVHNGDTIIVVSYASYDEDELDRYVPRVVHVREAHQPYHHSRRRGGNAAPVESEKKHEAGQPTVKRGSRDVQPTNHSRPNRSGRLPMTLPAPCARRSASASQS